MSDQPPPAIVDDYYWLGRAGKLIEDAVEIKKATADRLVSAVAWLASTFTLFATTLFATKVAEPDPLTMGACSATAVVVMVTYLLAVYAAAPTYLEFDPRVPAQVEQAHARMATTALSRIRMATAGTVVAAMGVIASMVVLTGSHSSAASVPQLRAVLDSGGQPAVVVTGKAPKATGSVPVAVIPEGGPTKSVPAKVDDQGNFAAAVPVASASSYRVRVSWTDDDGSVITIESAVT